MKTWGDQGVGLNSGGMALQWFPIQQLLWLPVPLRVEFRLAVLVRKAVNSLTYNCHRSPSTLIVRQLQVFRPQNTLTSSRRLKPGPHQQQCRRNIVECYNVECCFDIVAVFGNNVESTFDFVAKTATMSNEFCVEISCFRQSRTLL